MTDDVPKDYKELLNTALSLGGERVRRNIELELQIRYAIKALRQGQADAARDILERAIGV